MTAATSATWHLVAADEHVADAPAADVPEAMVPLSAFLLRRNPAATLLTSERSPVTPRLGAEVSASITCRTHNGLRSVTVVAVTDGTLAKQDGLAVERLRRRLSPSWASLRSSTVGVSTVDVAATWLFLAAEDKSA